MELRRVVITGLGALTPIGNSVTEYWNNLIGGVCGAGPITRFDVSKFKTHYPAWHYKYGIEDTIKEIYEAQK